MGYNLLSRRLRAVASLIKHGARVADIGTDHAHLPIFLIKNDIASSVIAADLRKGPLESAEKNVKKSGVKGIELILSDGLKAISPETFDTAVMAGMGGNMICAIIAGAEYLKNPSYTLIVQPQNHIEDVRRYFYKNGFEITCDKFAFENEKLYSIISAVYTGKERRATRFRCIVSRAMEKERENRLFAVYIEKNLARLYKKREGLTAAEKRNKSELRRVCALIDRLSLEV